MPRTQSEHAATQSTAMRSSAERQRAHVWIGLALVLLATCIAYLPSLDGRVLWDDDAHITRPELQSLDGLRRIWFEPGATQQYYPLLHSAFWVEHWLWGDAVEGYHAVNLLWHLVAVWLVYVVLVRLRIPGALLAAAIFALHPVMVESVAWITEQKNTLSAVFYLVAMFVYLQFDDSRRGSLYAMAGVLFILGLLTKTVTATLPAALLVIFWWQRGKLSWKRDVLPLVPFFAIGAVAGVATAWIERRMIGAEGVDFGLSLVQRSLLAGRVIWFYLAKLVWPANLVFVYPRWSIDPHVWWQWLFSVSVVAVTAALWAIRRRSRGPLAGWLFFVGTLFPVLGFLNVYPFLYSYVADHFQYLASLGPIVLVAAGVSVVISRLPADRNWLAVAACVAVISILAALTWQQGRMYADNMALYQATLDRNPDCWMAHFNIAWLQAEAGKTDDAVAHYRATLRLRPAFADAHNNLGRVLIDAGRFAEAAAECRAATELKPDMHQAFNNLGIALDHEGHYAEALEAQRHAIRIRPDFAESYENMGNTLLRLGKSAEALAAIREAVRLQPDDAEARNNLGTVLAETGKTEDAIEQFRQAARLAPNDPKAHANLGKMLMDTDQLAEAADQLQQALALAPDRGDLHNCLGEVLAKTGRGPDAIEHFAAAVQYDPNLAEAYLNLAQSLAATNRPQEALAAAERGLAVARATHQPEALQAIEAWLKEFRAKGAGRP